jgi:hypothetical protein
MKIEEIKCIWYHAKIFLYMQILYKRMHNNLHFSMDADPDLDPHGSALILESGSGYAPE